MHSDSQLVNRVRESQTVYYARLVARYEHAAIVTALRVLGDYHAAEDVVQECFVAAYAQLSSLRDGSKFGPWLLKIVHREAIRVSKQRRPIVPIDSVAEPEATAHNGRGTNSDVSLANLLERLPDHERLVVVLHHLDGLRAREIANATGRSVGTVTKQLTRAMARLRTWAQREEPRG